MRKTFTKTITLQQIPPTPGDLGTSAPTSANVICGPVSGPTRVLVRNISIGIDVFLSVDDEQALLSLPINSGTYVLPAGFSDELILTKDQKLFAAASGAGAQLSMAVSPWLSAKDVDGSDQ